LHDIPEPRKIVWLGNSLKNIVEFPDGAKKLIGDERLKQRYNGAKELAKDEKETKN
jgi:hypothetical protein